MNIPRFYIAKRITRPAMLLATGVLTAVIGGANPVAAIDQTRFETAYANIEEWMFSTDGELAEVRDFEYRKDAATFHFEDGKMLLRRPIEGRPTVAIFIGAGSVSITVPLHVERQRAAMMTGDSVIQEQFDICYIRFADDFDLELKKAFSFRAGALSANEFRRLKSAQGDYFFKPIPQHRTDNYFQLLRSAFGRTTDGLFWSCFGKFVFSFDPNRPEEVEILYNREPSSIVAFRAARFPREERLPTDSVEPRATAIYPTRGLDQETCLEFDGADGCVIAAGRSTITVCPARDSTHFASLYLDDLLEIDSVFCDGQTVPYHRRKNFDHVGVALPEWYYSGDTLKLRLHYHGRDYESPYPQLENPSGYSHSLEVNAPASYNYPLLGAKQVDEQRPDRSFYQIVSGPNRRAPEFLAQATGWDTLSTSTSWGQPVHYTWPRRKQFSLLHEDHKRLALEQALEYYYGILGEPNYDVELFVAPQWSHRGPRRHPSHTGIVRVGYTSSRDDLGGFHNQAGEAAVTQWLGDCANPNSHRETWMMDALPVYLKMLFIQDAVGDEPFNFHLSRHRQTVLSVQEKDQDFPMGSGVEGWTSKGVWVLHMLRNMMNAADTTRDGQFLAWLKQVVTGLNAGPFSNADFQRLAEQYFGYDLSGFFNHWLYGTGIPAYEVSYSISREQDGFHVDMKIITRGTGEDFLMPILIRVDLPGSPAYNNLFVAAKYQKYRIGPFAEEPISVHFNRYLSVLSEDKISRSD